MGQHVLPILSITRTFTSLVLQRKLINRLDIL